MTELHLCKGMRPLKRGGVQYYCTVCHTFRRVKITRGETQEQRPGEMPMDYRALETRGRDCEHATGNLYVSNKRTKARFDKSGSY